MTKTYIGHVEALLITHMAEIFGIRKLDRIPWLSCDPT